MRRGSNRRAQCTPRARGRPARGPSWSTGVLLVAVRLGRQFEGVRFYGGRLMHVPRHLADCLWRCGFDGTGDISNVHIFQQCDEETFDGDSFVPSQVRTATSGWAARLRSPATPEAGPGRAGAGKCRSVCPAGDILLNRHGDNRAFRIPVPSRRRRTWRGSDGNREVRQSPSFPRKRESRNCGQFLVIFHETSRARDQRVPSFREWRSMSPFASAWEFAYVIGGCRKRVRPETVRKPAHWALNGRRPT